MISKEVFTYLLIEHIFRAVKYPMAPHPTFKKGFGVSFLLIIWIVILHIPFYIATKVSSNGACYIDFRGISPFTEKLDDMSYDEETGQNTGMWNHILIALPISIVGFIFPSFLVGLFYHKATKAMNTTFKALAIKMETGKDSENRITPNAGRKKIKSKERKSPKKNTSPAVLRRQKENRLVSKLMLCITIFTCVVYVPYFVMDWVTMLFPKVWLNHTLDMVKALTLLSYLFILHSSVSSLFYAGMHKEVKKLAKRMVCKKQGRV